jgi:hypothetical protein
MKELNFLRRDLQKGRGERKTVRSIETAFLSRWHLAALLNGAVFGPFALLA